MPSKLAAPPAMIFLIVTSPDLSLFSSNSPTPVRHEGEKALQKEYRNRNAAVQHVQIEHITEMNTIWLVVTAAARWSTQHLPANCAGLEASCGPGDGERARLPGVDAAGSDGTYCSVLITLAVPPLSSLSCTADSGLASPATASGASPPSTAPAFNNGSDRDGLLQRQQTTEERHGSVNARETG